MELGSLFRLILFNLLDNFLVKAYLSNSPHIITFWGQDPALQDANKVERALNKTCGPKSSYSTVVLGFVSKSIRNKTTASLPPMHCVKSAKSRSKLSLYCPEISKKVEQCKLNKKKVLIGVGGPNETLYFDDARSAQYFAKKIWNWFLGGTEISEMRPFGGIALDGVNIFLKDDKSKYVDVFLKTLNTLRNRVDDDDNTKYVYTMSVPCNAPEAYFGDGKNRLSLDKVVPIIKQIYVRYSGKQCCKSGPKHFRGELQEWKKFSITKDRPGLFVLFPRSPHKTMTNCFSSNRQLNILHNITKLKKGTGSPSTNHKYESLKDVKTVAALQSPLHHHPLLRGIVVAKIAQTKAHTSDSNLQLSRYSPNPPKDGVKTYSRAALDIIKDIAELRKIQRTIQLATRLRHSTKGEERSTKLRISPDILENFLRKSFLNNNSDIGEQGDEFEMLRGKINGPDDTTEKGFSSIRGTDNDNMDTVNYMTKDEVLSLDEQELFSKHYSDGEKHKLRNDLKSLLEEMQYDVESANNEDEKQEKNLTSPNPLNELLLTYLLKHDKALDNYASPPYLSRVDDIDMADDALVVKPDSRDIQGILKTGNTTIDDIDMKDDASRKTMSQGRRKTNADDSYVDALLQGAQPYMLNKIKDQTTKTFIRNDDPKSNDVSYSIGSNKTAKHTKHTKSSKRPMLRKSSKQHVSRKGWRSYNIEPKHINKVYHLKGNYTPVYYMKQLYENKFANEIEDNQKIGLPSLNKAERELRHSLMPYIVDKDATSEHYPPMLSSLVTQHDQNLINRPAHDIRTNLIPNLLVKPDSEQEEINRKNGIVWDHTGMSDTKSDMSTLSQQQMTTASSLLNAMPFGVAKVSSLPTMPSAMTSETANAGNSLLTAGLPEAANTGSSLITASQLANTGNAWARPWPSVDVDSLYSRLSGLDPSYPRKFYINNSANKAATPFNDGCASDGINDDNIKAERFKKNCVSPATNSFVNNAMSTNEVAMPYEMNSLSSLESVPIEEQYNSRVSSMFNIPLISPETGMPMDVPLPKYKLRGDEKTTEHVAQQNHKDAASMPLQDIYGNYYPGHVPVTSENTGTSNSDYTKTQSTNPANIKPVKNANPPVPPSTHNDSVILNTAIQMYNNALEAIAGVVAKYNNSEESLNAIQKSQSSLPSNVLPNTGVSKANSELSLNAAQPYDINNIQKSISKSSPNGINIFDLNEIQKSLSAATTNMGLTKHTGEPSPGVNPKILGNGAPNTSVPKPNIESSLNVVQKSQETPFSDASAHNTMVELPQLTKETDATLKAKYPYNEYYPAAPPVKLSRTDQEANHFKAEYTRFKVGLMRLSDIIGKYRVATSNVPVNAHSGFNASIASIANTAGKSQAKTNNVVQDVPVITSYVISPIAYNQPAPVVATNTILNYISPTEDITLRRTHSPTNEQSPTKQSSGKHNLDDELKSISHILEKSTSYEGVQNILVPQFAPENGRARENVSSPIKQSNANVSQGYKRHNEMVAPDWANPLKRPSPPQSFQEQYEDNVKYLKLLQGDMQASVNRYNQDIIKEQAMNTSGVNTSKTYPFELPEEELDRVNTDPNMGNPENYLSKYYIGARESSSIMNNATSLLDDNDSNKLTNGGNVNDSMLANVSVYSTLNNSATSALGQPGANVTQVQYYTNNDIIDILDETQPYNNFSLSNSTQNENETIRDSEQRHLDGNVNVKGNMDQLKSLMSQMQQDIDNANAALQEKNQKKLEEKIIEEKERKEKEESGDNEQRHLVNATNSYDNNNITSFNSSDSVNDNKDLSTETYTKDDSNERQDNPNSNVTGDFDLVKALVTQMQMDIFNTNAAIYAQGHQNPLAAQQAQAQIQQDIYSTDAALYAHRHQSKPGKEAQNGEKLTEDIKKKPKTKNER